MTVSDLTPATLLILEILEARSSNDKETLYNQLYRAITHEFKDQFTEDPPANLEKAIACLVKFFEDKQEFEKCTKLHQAGYEIYNRTEQE
jgi:hypothetical protein